MPCFECLACKTRLHSTASEADPIGDLYPVCGSLLEPVGDLGEIVGYGVIEARGGRSHSGASAAGQLIAGRVGGILARRELKHPLRARVGIKSCDAQSASPRVQAVSSRVPGAGDEAVRGRPPQPRSRAAGTAAVLGALTRAVIGASGAARGRFALRPRRLAMYRLGPV